MYMKRIEEKIGGRKPGSSKAAELQYSSPEALRADFKRIYDNCMTYNEPGVSPYNYPPAKEVVARMLAAVDQLLAKQHKSGSLTAALASANVRLGWGVLRWASAWVCREGGGEGGSRGSGDDSSRN